MAERKSQQKYYPPDWDPSKGSLNTYHGQHALRERASKLHLGILVVRMEMPFNVWCEGCKNHIGRGVRYNAEKRQVGTYFSTKIWAFRMKCHLCDNYMELWTDPKNKDYVCKSGMRRKVETYSAKDAGAMEIPDAEEKEKLELDPIYKLEHQNADQSKGQQAADQLQRIHAVQNTLYHDDYDNYRAARAVLRSEKKDVKEDKKQLRRKHIKLPLPLPAAPEDEAVANAVQFGKFVEAHTSHARKRARIAQADVLTARAPSAQVSPRAQSSLLLGAPGAGGEAGLVLGGRRKRVRGSDGGGSSSGVRVLPSKRRAHSLGSVAEKQGTSKPTPRGVSAGGEKSDGEGGGGEGGGGEGGGCAPSPKHSDGGSEVEEGEGQPALSLLVAAYGDEE